MLQITFRWQHGTYSGCTVSLHCGRQFFQTCFQACLSVCARNASSGGDSEPQKGHQRFHLRGTKVLVHAEYQGLAHGAESGKGASVASPTGRGHLPYICTEENPALQRK